jgi:Na+/H+ antiporter NhaC
MKCKSYTSKKEENKRGGIFQLIPFGIFIFLYLIITIFFFKKESSFINKNYSHQVISSFSFSGLSIFIAIIAIFFSLFTFPSSYNLSITEKIRIIIRKGSSSTLITMIYILILSSSFGYVLEKIGGINAAAEIGLQLIPKKYIMPGFFILVSIFSLSIGSATGTVATLLPFGLGLSNVLNVDPSFITALIISGSSFGDNLSLISDTTIATIQTTKCNIKRKLYKNIKLVLFPFLLTIVLLFYFNRGLNYEKNNSISTISIIFNFKKNLKILPFLFIIIFGLFGSDVLIILLLAIVSSCLVGFYQNTFTLQEIFNVFNDGFSNTKEMHEIFILTFLITSLSGIIEYTGGINYLINFIGKLRKNKIVTELIIILLTIIINFAVAINTVAILTVGKIASRIGDKCNISRERTACLIDTTSCIIWGFIPYAPHILLSINLSKVSIFEIFTNFYYQFFCFISIFISILFRRKSFNKNF